MSPENFCYWLKGFLELTDSKSITKEQMKMISEHLELVFKKVTPQLQSVDSATGTISKDWFKEAQKTLVGIGDGITYC